MYDNNNDISDEQYKELMQAIETVTMVYEDIMKALSDWQNKGENYNKLINHCKLLDTRVHEFYNNESNDESRQKFLKQKYDVTEKIYFDSNYIRHIFWFKYNKQLKYDSVLKVLKKYKDHGTVIEQDDEDEAQHLHGDVGEDDVVLILHRIAKQIDDCFGDSRTHNAKADGMQESIA